MSVRVIAVLNSTRASHEQLLGVFSNFTSAREYLASRNVTKEDPESHRWNLINNVPLIDSTTRIFHTEYPVKYIVLRQNDNPLPIPRQPPAIPTFTNHASVVSLTLSEAPVTAFELGKVYIIEYGLPYVTNGISVAIISPQVNENNEVFVELSHPREPDEKYILKSYTLNHRNASRAGVEVEVVNAEISTSRRTATIYRLSLIEGIIV